MVEETTDVDRSFIPLSLNAQVYTHVSVGVLTRTPLLQIHPGGFNYILRIDCGCLAVFPRQKGRTKCISILLILSFGHCLVGLIINRDIVWNRIIIPGARQLTQPGFIKIALLYYDYISGLFCISQLWWWV